MNNEKRELPRTRTRHLGFIVDLELKRLSITDKHKRKITALFNLFLIKQGSGVAFPSEAYRSYWGYKSGYPQYLESQGSF